MENQEEKNIEETMEGTSDQQQQIEPAQDNEPINYNTNGSKCDGNQRPNERLLRLAKLNQEINHSETKSTELNVVDNSLSSGNTIVTQTIDPVKKSETVLDIPPPSYESVVKFNKELNSTYTIPSSSQLPRYEDVGGLSDAPPSYHSLFTESMLRVIHPFNSDSENVLNYNAQRAKWSQILINILLFIFMISFVFLLPVSMIAMGIIYVHKCPVQPRLPIYLIVLGFFQMLECCGRLAFKLFQSQNSRQNETWRDRYRRKDPLIYFVIVWFIIGSMWVYQTDPFCKGCSNVIKNEPNNITAIINNVTTVTIPTPFQGLPVNKLYEPRVPCDKTIYSFAFWIVTSYYSVIAFFFLLVLFDVVTRVASRFCCPAQQATQER